jgi:hypothetical protein
MLIKHFVGLTNGNSFVLLRDTHPVRTSNDPVRMLEWTDHKAKSGHLHDSGHYDVSLEKNGISRRTDIFGVQKERLGECEVPNHKHRYMYACI